MSASIPGVEPTASAASLRPAGASRGTIGGEVLRIVWYAWVSRVRCVPMSRSIAGYCPGGLETAYFISSSLPLANPIAAFARMTVPFSGPSTVLVVEDDPIIRMDAIAMIEDAGFVVIEAANADDAIALLEARPDISIVFTDIEMPGTMDGLKLAHAVRQRWPPVILIVASGRVSPLVHEMPSDTVFLRKPYSAAMVVKALRLAA
jgi:CheY-like chemotaxis protein